MTLRMALFTIRTVQAGRLLAHVLMGGGHGDRPVTLVGHSMAARVIFHCLLELCRHNCKGVYLRRSLAAAKLFHNPAQVFRYSSSVWRSRLHNRPHPL